MSKARTPKRHTHKKDDHPFAVKKSKIAGKGAFATRRIRKGQRIIEYIGERITHKEADRRYDDEAMRNHHTFLFSIDETHVIDAAVRGNDARFINHACDPNCEAVDEDGHIFIEAIKNINIGQELTYDYQFERDDADDPEVEARYPCLCGAPKCRGTILAPTKKQRKAEKKKAKQEKKAQKQEKKAQKKEKATSKQGVVEDQVAEQEVIYRRTIAFLALVNALVALYLHLWKLGMAGTLSCGGEGGCAYVQLSSYGWFMGVDVALIGVIGYALIFVVAVAGALVQTADAPWPTSLLIGLIGPAVLFTARLKYGEFIVLKSFCPWCAVSAVSITVCAVLVFLDYRRVRAPRTT